MRCHLYDRSLVSYVSRCLLMWSSHLQHGLGCPLFSLYFFFKDNVCLYLILTNIISITKWRFTVYSRSEVNSFDCVDVDYLAKLVIQYRWKISILERISFSPFIYFLESQTEIIFPAEAKLINTGEKQISKDPITFSFSPAFLGIKWDIYLVSTVSHSCQVFCLRVKMTFLVLTLQELRLTKEIASVEHLFPFGWPSLVEKLYVVLMILMAILIKKDIQLFLISTIIAYNIYLFLPILCIRLYLIYYQ